VVGDAVEDRGLAGAASALSAGGQHADADFFGGVEDRLLRRDGEGQPALGEVDLDGLVQDGIGEGFGYEPLDVQGAFGPGGAVLLERPDRPAERIDQATTVAWPGRAPDPGSAAQGPQERGAHPPVPQGLSSITSQHELPPIADTSGVGQ
jgi:hypothetical protein